MQDRIRQLIAADKLEKAIVLGLQEASSDYIVDLYKKGKLKARDAWKRSGLEYNEFQARVQ